MKIDPKLCVGCGNCVAVCPMGAISVDSESGRASIDPAECVECFACFRGMTTETLNPALVRGARRFLGLLRLRFDPEPDVCPTSAIVPEELEWPRTVRHAFSDVQAPHDLTCIHGRGTEEVKTNDVTGRVGMRDIGFVVELGRPALGAHFHEIDRVARRLAASGVIFEADNPVTGLMTDPARGTIDPEVLEEKVMSAIIEFKVGLDRVPGVLAVLEEVGEEIDTVMAVGVSARCDVAGRSPVERILAEEGYEVVRAKTNIGIGHLETSNGAAPEGRAR